jgi:hypothetical protein
MSERLQKQLIQHLFQQLVISCGGHSFNSFVQHDFIDTSLSAMKVLHDKGKHNLVYHISRCFNCEGERAETRMPIDRMPFGLIDYNVRFFSSPSSQKLGIENHYAIWLETMLAHFGQKWLCLFRGPFWQYEMQEYADASLHSSTSQKSCDVNAGMESIIETALQECSLNLNEYQGPVGEITSTSGLSEQVALQILNDVNIEEIVIDHNSGVMKASNPNGRWWIKADACDVRDGLRESVRGIWSGDEDFGDGSVESLHAECASKCNTFKRLFAQQHSSVSIDDLKTLVDEFVDDTEFLKDGMASAKEKYEKKLTNFRCSDDLLMKLAWDVVGFEQLLKQANEFKNELELMIDDLKLCLQNVVVTRLRNLRGSIMQYYKDLYSKKRSPASHLLVFMLADELRNVKPYAVPIQFLPIKSITDDQSRQLEHEIEALMKSNGMVTVGM